MSDQVSKPARADVRARVLLMAEEEIGAKPGSVAAESTWLDVFDSLDETAYILRVEAEFGVSLQPPFAGAAAEIEARRPFRMSDFVDLIIVQWGAGWSAGAKCPGCGYSLAGLMANICPECGGALGQPGDLRAASTPTLPAAPASPPPSGSLRR
jgi:hypothetical protein